MKNSRYSVGDRLVVTHTYHGFGKMEKVTVVDPEKKKINNEYCILVRKAGGIERFIPTKYVAWE